MKLSKNLPSRRRDTLCGQTDRRTGHEANSPFRKFANAPLKCCTGKKISLCSQIHTKQLNKPCGQKVTFLDVKRGETYNNNLIQVVKPKSHTIFKLEQTHTVGTVPVYHT